MISQSIQRATVHDAPGAGNNRNSLEIDIIGPTAKIEPDGARSSAA